MPDGIARAAFAPLQVAVVRAATLGPAGSALLALDAETILRVPGVPARPASRLLLVTCERLTLVLWGAAADAATVLHTILGHHGLLVHYSGITRFDGGAAVQHLISLAAGLESPRRGETEILGQLRRAWCDSRTLGATDAALDALLQRVVGGARHVRAALPPSAEVESLGAAAVRAILEHGATPLTSRRVLVVGTGDAATSTLAAVAASAPERLSVIGRTPARVEAVASRFAALPLAWATLDAALAAHDVVVFAVRTTAPIVDAREFDRGPRAVWIDLGMPPAVADGSAVSSLDYVPLAAIHGERDADHASAVRGAHAVAVEFRRYVGELARRSNWSADGGTRDIRTSA